MPSLALDDSIETPAVSVLVEHLAREVDLHVVLTRQPSLGRPVELPFGLSVVGAASEPLRRVTKRALATLWREHRRRPFDVLHALWLHEPGTIAVLAGRVLRLPVVASIGGAEVADLSDINYGGLRSRRGRLVASQVLRRATLITGGSRYVLELAQRHEPQAARRLRLAPLPVDVERFTPPDEAPRMSRAPNLLHAASLLPVKDQATLLVAFRHIADQWPGATLLIAGEDTVGLRPQLERLRDELGLAGHVTFAGRLPHAEMPALYRRADLFLISSRHESQGMVVLEAAASRVATAGTSVGVVPDLAPDAAAAVPPAAPEALARESLTLLSDRQRRLALGQAAYDAVHTRYAPPAAVTRFIEMYREARGER